VKHKRIEVLVKELFTSELGKEVIKRLYLREVIGKKDYSNPTVLAAQAARSDLVTELMAYCEMTVKETKAFDHEDISNDPVVIEQDDFFSN